MYTFEKENDYQIRDNIRGTVIGSCSKGIFLELEDGEEAFARFGKLEIGTTVLCTIRKNANEYWRMLVSIDSVYEDIIAA